MRRELVVVSAILAGCGGVGGTEPSAGTTWRVVSLEADGELLSVDQPLFLDIFDDGFNASTPCNDVFGEFGGEIGSTDMGCDDARTELQQLMAQAFGAQPARDGDRLVFDAGDVRLVYEPFTDPQPEDLFSVLGNAGAGAGADESALPPEEATGTLPPEFESLVPLPAPSSDIDVFLGTLDGDVCIVYATATAIDRTCDSPRLAGARAMAVDIPLFERPIARVALIPDRFAAAAATRPDLGTYEANLLTVPDDAAAGRHVLTDDTGATFQVVIPPPWVDHRAASTTQPEP